MIGIIGLVFSVTLLVITPGRLDLRGMIINILGTSEGNQMGSQSDSFALETVKIALLIIFALCIIFGLFFGEGKVE
jgi:hypothetical protein